MRISLHELRQLIRCEVDRLVRNSAGLFGGGMGHDSVGTPGPAPDEMNPDPRDDDEEENVQKEKLPAPTAEGREDRHHHR